MRILLAEDEHKVASFIQRGLEAEHYSIDVVHDGEAALSRVTQDDYDVLILDIMLPKRDGLSVLQEIRRRSRRVPVLLLTARDTVTDEVAGLDCGADDYLTKPLLIAGRGRVPPGTHELPRGGGPSERADRRPAVPGAVRWRQYRRHTDTGRSRQDTR